MSLRMSDQMAMSQLQEKWGFDEDRAQRILEIARRVGPNSEPVTGGLITVTYRGRSHKPGVRLYTIESFTGEKLARKTPVRYNQGTSTRSIPQERRPNMPPAKTKAARTAPAAAPDEPEVAETAAPDLSVYLDKPFSPTMSDYADWFVEEFGEKTMTELTWDRLVVLGSQLYPHFQKSDLNISRKAERKAARDAAVAANGDAEEEAPARPAAAKTAPRRGRKPAAAAAPY